MPARRGTRILGLAIVPSSGAPDGRRRGVMGLAFDGDGDGARP
jgi:hypothetical protein